MPTRKQRRRQAKSQRHEYEFVYVDEQGNEVDDAPEQTAAAKPERRNSSKPSAAKRPARVQTSRRTPSPPSWQRASKRALILGAVVFVLFTFTAKKGHNAYATAIVPAVIYTALFIPFTFMIDRFAYRRWQAREEQAKKR